MVEFITGRIDFPSRRDFLQHEDENVTFSNPIRDFVVILTGYELKFDREEHPLHLANIDVQGTLVPPSTVEVECVLGWRDHSGFFNDDYTGYVAYAVIAETE